LYSPVLLLVLILLPLRQLPPPALILWEEGAARIILEVREGKMCLLEEGSLPKGYRLESDRELILSYGRTPLRRFRLESDRLEVRDGRGNFLYARELSLPVRNSPQSALSEKRRHRSFPREGGIYPED